MQEEQEEVYKKVCNKDSKASGKKKFMKSLKELRKKVCKKTNKELL